MINVTSFYQPTEGFKSSFTQTLPMIADNNTIVNGYEFSKYHEFFDEMVGTLSFFVSAVNSLDDDDVRISKRLYMPGRRLRGFETGKVGPKRWI